jgi:hypothetical protein
VAFVAKHGNVPLPDLYRMTLADTATPIPSISGVYRIRPVWS